MRERKTEVTEVLLRIASIIVVSGIIWVVGGNYLQKWQIHRITQLLTLKFPVGTDFSVAKTAVESAYPGRNTIVAPAELPLGVFTALIGTPFFVALLLRQRAAWNL